jgi:hypothetical protein
VRPIEFNPDGAEGTPGPDDLEVLDSTDRSRITSPVRRRRRWLVAIGIAIGAAAAVMVPVAIRMAASPHPVAAPSRTPVFNGPTAPESTSPAPTPVAPTTAAPATTVTTLAVPAGTRTTTGTGTTTGHGTSPTKPKPIAPPVSTSSTSTGPALMVLGGFSGDQSLLRYCQTLEYDDATLTADVSQPYNNWKCIRYSTGELSGYIDFDAACHWAYSQPIAAAAPTDPNSAYTWVCYTYGS